MKNAITLKVDPLGRITIPSPYRKAMGVSGGDSMKMEYKDRQLIVWKPTKSDLEMCIDMLMYVAKNNGTLTDVELTELEMITNKLAKEDK